MQNILDGICSGTFNILNHDLLKAIVNDYGFSAVTKVD